MIRVLQIVGSMNRGGLETFLMNVYRNVNRRVVQFDFLVHTDNTCAYDEEIRDMGGRIYSVPPRSAGFLRNRIAINFFFREHTEYRVVHQHVSSLSYVEPLRAAKRYGIPVRIIHSHSTRQGGSRFHRLLHEYNQISVRSYATDHYACSDLAAKWLYGPRQYGQGDFILINNGVETAKFRFDQEKRDQMRSALGIEGKFVLGSVGRFSYPKNHDFLLDVFRVVHEREPRSVLLLVGDGELRSKIKEKSEILGLGHSIFFAGVRSDVPDLLQAIDVVVMPSHYEGLPVALVEAQTSGLPCVVSSNITEDVRLTEHIHYIDLSSPLQTWASKVLEYETGYVRRDQSQQVIDSGFDVREVAQYLQEKYTAGRSY